ncbi:uncharacterized protein LOC135823643 [Sycon ciliatum]|uniref:uncharacterized protein LOC135823643 n=1 Tax=Sycon ciliatum TaxID=27933 RepID=UPI0031F65711
MATGRRYLYGNAPGPSVDNTKPTTSQSDRIANNDRPKTAPAPHSKTLHTRKFKSADGYTQIAGYKIGGFLGAGIYTNVWEVTDKSTNTKRAMKIYEYTVPVDHRNAVEEVRQLQGCKHPSMCEIRHVFMTRYFQEWGEIINPVNLGKTIPDSCAGQHKNQYAALNKVLMFVCLMVNGMGSTESNGSAGLRQPQQGGRPSNSGDGTGIEVDKRGPGQSFLGQQAAEMQHEPIVITRFRELASTANQCLVPTPPLNTPL